MLHSFVALLQILSLVQQRNRATRSTSPTAAITSVRDYEKFSIDRQREKEKEKGESERVRHLKIFTRFTCCLSITGHRLYLSDYGRCASGKRKSKRFPIKRIISECNKTDNHFIAIIQKTDNDVVK